MTPDVDPLDLVDPERFARRGYPHEVWTRLRAEAPVARIEAPGFHPFWAITKHADIVEVSSQPEVFSSAYGITLAPSQQPLVPLKDAESAHYVRLRVADTPGVLKAITSILAELDISIEAILQKEPKGKEDAMVAIITSVVAEQRFAAALEKLLALKFVRPGSTHLRVEHFNGR